MSSFFILLTIIVFLAMRKLYIKIKNPLLLPIVTSVIAIIVILILFDFEYETYMTGGRWIHELLGAAVVALAYPLYEQRKKMIKYKTPLFIGIGSGITSGIVTGFIFVNFISLDKSIAISILPKSVTAPVAMDLATISGGIPSLASVFVMIAGVSGAVLGPYILKSVGVKHYIGIGIAYGCASHGIGTAKAIEYGEKEGAVSSISMTLSALIYALILPHAISYFMSF
ncbi:MULTISPECIES: LrgB family protein [Sutcliffiella]|uniref:LrgB family protein n=1 Tax=Sutcliffiella cohnii TaxID=33932 RepID=A0A223KTS4_9BACI|nr:MULTISPECIES: LrgB family protein [Sutcliffiella]AST92905.1 hypothetical protein BC6307_17230 [Sutcliffiella cohnii]WBL14163.1 LrgB family protein [Sutcliffiella sp. NC1]